MVFSHFAHMTHLPSETVAPIAVQQVKLQRETGPSAGGSFSSC